MTVLVSETTLAIELPNADDLVVRRTRCSLTPHGIHRLASLDQGRSARPATGHAAILVPRSACRSACTWVMWLGESASARAATRSCSRRATLARARTHADPVHGTEVVEFSPTEELGRTMEVVTKNIGGGGGVGGELELPCSDSHSSWQALSEGKYLSR